MARPPYLRVVADHAGPAPATRMAGADPESVDDPTLRAELATLEVEIEALAARAETCRKIAHLATGLTLAGAVLLVLLALGVFGQAPGALIFGLSGLLGGLALGGTNASTRAEAVAALGEREAERNDMRSFLALRLKRAYREE